MMDRRTFLGASLALVSTSAVSVFARADGHGLVSPELERTLATSPFVYVSPLRADGRESTCHAEVWYAWIDGAVVMVVASDRWKANAIRRGLDTARVWVGDYGRWKRMMSRNEEFLQGPSFDARGSLSEDASLLEELIAAYGKKYPDEIGKWAPRFRKGVNEGTSVLVRYEPTAVRDAAARLRRVA